MKKKIIPLVVLLGTIGAYAQTGIGTTLPHGTTELEISSKDKGVLIPRVELVNETDVNTVKGGIYPESLLVYNTGKGLSKIEAGFYFWAADKWNALVSNSTLIKYIKETAKDGDVSITTNDGKDFIFTWIDKTTKEEKTITLGDLIKSLETDTPINATTKKVGEAIVNTGEYKYKSEKSAEITINVVEDVANNFDKVINNNEFKTVFNKYLTENVEGNVVYKNNKFYYTVKNGDTYEQKEITIEEIIKDNAYLASLQVTPVDENVGKVLGGFKFSSGKAGDAEVKFAETLTTIAKAKQTGTDPGTNFIAYNYKDETGQNATSQITVTSDVIESFNEIIKDTKVITELNNFISGATGSVTITKGPTGDVIIGYKDGDKVETVNLTTLIGEKETKTTITVGEETPGGKRTGVYTYKNEDKVDVQITVVDDITNNFDKIINTKTVQDIINKYLKENAEGNVTYEGGKFYYVKNEAGKITKEVIDISDLVKFSETDTPINATTKKVGEAIVNTGEYKYKSEKSAEITINVVEDVANNFDKVINNNEFKTVFNKYLTENVEGNVVYKNNKFYYTVKNGDTYEQKEITIEEIIKDNAYLASLQVTPVDENVGKVLGGFKFSSGKAGDAEVKFAETLTTIAKAKQTGTDPGTNFIAYNYKDETGQNATSQITVTSDVIESFNEIIKDTKVITELNNFISGATGSVTITKGPTGDIIIGYKDGDKVETVNLTTLIGEKETKTTITVGEETPGGKRTGVYTYKNEDKVDVQITVVDDITNNFDKIINTKTVQDIINKYLKENAEGNVTYEGGKFYYVKNEAGKITKEVIDISDLVKFSETDTPINATTKKVGEAIVNTGEYKYKSEKSAEITINVVEDVANNFDKVINNNEFKTVFNKYLTENVEGNVVYKNNKFYYTVKNGDTYEQKEITIEEIIKDNAYLASLQVTPVDENVGKVLGGFKFSSGKAGDAEVKFAETLTTIAKAKQTGTDPGTNFIAYNYKDETGQNATSQITVTSDVIESFNEIIKDTKVITELNNFISGATGSVTITKGPTGDIIIGYKDGDKVETVNLTTLIGEKETKTTITIGEETPGGKRTGVYTYKNEDKVDVQITVVDDITNNFDKIINTKTVQDIINKYLKENAEGNVTYEGGKFYYVKNEAGKITKEVIDISDLVKFSETDTPINATTKKVGEAIVNTGEYKYKSEKSAEITINVVEDVANNFDKVINNNEFKTVFNKYLTENVEGNVVYKNNKFYYTVKNGDTYEQKEITIEEIIKDNAYLASLQVTPVDENVGKVLGGFKFSSGKAGDAEVKFAETLTTIAKAKQTGTDPGTNFIAYNYKDETGQNATSQITVTSDVIESFNEIIKDTKVITELNNFISGATGSVTITKGPTGDIIIGYKDGDKVETVNLTTLIGEKETKTDIKKTNAAGVEVAIETKPAVGMIFYEYENENKAKRYISVSQDVSDDFSKIVENNKTILENLIKQTGGNASISKDTNDNIIITNIETKEDFNITDLIKANGAIAKLELTAAANNVNAVKAGFTFNDGKTSSSDVKFAETLTKVTMVPLKIFVYEEIDPNTFESKKVHTEIERPNEVPEDTYITNKFVYTNEAGEEIDIKGSDLFGGKDENGNAGGSIETLTSLYLDPNYGSDGTNKGTPALVYSDEKRALNPILISKMFQQSETTTTLELSKVNRELVYTNELISQEQQELKDKAIVKIPLDDLIQEPWFVAKSATQTFNKQATKNDEDIYTMGWVGIGYSEKSEKANDIKERLRVNGSITATNSYYADYVFESYFNGYSSLKYDYKFNDLNSVDNFIRTNRHLPGITPINELRKTDTGYSFNVSELSIQLLEKTEELFLHVIDQQKELNAKETRIEKLESEMSEMAKRLQALEVLLVK
ncbi:hypothetical protein LNQ81_10940 [Myroides sp. M-43]|uniref:hypothetical protein n=1 Tax=Myroides oncorhynchi TaxID=2893756 RepID=UPI001E5F6631|nr:hypothetical protein [Myroides oncorhynchi]MCC9043189.1 hypothetical protein [Myroides oncorhynchi]